MQAIPSDVDTWRGWLLCHRSQAKPRGERGTGEGGVVSVSGR